MFENYLIYINEQFINLFVILLYRHENCSHLTKKGFSMKKTAALLVLGLFVAAFTVSPVLAENFSSGNNAPKVQKEGLKQGLKDGAKDGMKYGAKDGMKYGAKAGAKDGLKYGLKDGLKNGLKDGAKNGQINGEKKVK